MMPSWLQTLQAARARDCAPATPERLAAQARIVDDARRALRGDTPSRLEGRAQA